jgi:hypothetical protein
VAEAPPDTSPLSPDGSGAGRVANVHPPRSGSGSGSCFRNRHSLGVSGPIQFRRSHVLIIGPTFG